jgi:DNA mismatch repair protein MutS2
LREFLAAARPGALLLIDEIAVGTDPEQGAALEQATLEAFADRGATVIVTTHYDRLKVLPTADPRFVNASVGFDVERLSPTYELQLGVPGASGAIVVAKRLGLDAAVCARATSLLGIDQVGMERLLLDISAERRRVADERARAEAERASAARAREEAERTAVEAKAKLERARKGAHDEAVETLRRARQELDRTATVLRRSSGQVTAADLTRARREIETAAAEVHKAQPAPPPPPGRPAEPADLKNGAEVFVTRVQGRGRVLAPPKGKKVLVQVGALKLTVALDELRMTDDKATVSARAARGHNAFDAAPPAPAHRGGVPTVDVRGERVEVAVALAEKFLDDALRTGAEAVIVVHGHGTGALREALRQQLAGFPGVSGVRPGEPREGGDGATVISLA